MSQTGSARPSGRKAQAARNDDLILEAARDVFVADSGAPISAVAERAGVGISALYRRYASKEELLRKLCSDGLATYTALVEAALDESGDPWRVFATFMRAVVDADTHSLTLRLAGTFTPTEELGRAARRADELNNQLLDRFKTTGVVRPDIETADLGLIFEQLAAVRAGDDARTAELRNRYVALFLDGLRTRPGEPLPGPPPTQEEIGRRWYT
jgi:AcrR family transcriptional regulator